MCGEGLFVPRVATLGDFRGGSSGTLGLGPHPYFLAKVRHAGLAKIFEKVRFDPYNFRITRLSARKSEQMKNFRR